MGNSSGAANKDPNTASVAFTVRDFLVTNKPAVPKYAFVNVLHKKHEFDKNEK